ncbi:flagellar basal body-associated protein FliL [Labrenzia sp. MBR-25]|jgi:flagellar basal body-associated protein FliL
MNKSNIFIVVLLFLSATAIATFIFVFHDKSETKQEKHENRSTGFDPTKYPMTGGQEMKPDFGNSKGGN